MTVDSLLTTPATIPAEVETSSIKIVSTSLQEAVRRTTRQYLLSLEPLTDLYFTLLSEIEPPMLEIVLTYCHQNQCYASRILGISRGLLRKKMQQYGYLANGKRRDLIKDK